MSTPKGDDSDKERRQVPRAARALVKLPALQQRWRCRESQDFYLLRETRDILAYRHHYKEAGFDSFHKLFAFVTDRPAHLVPRHEPRRLLRPARSIKPAEGWQSSLGLSALLIVARHSPAERTVFFARARQDQKTGSKPLTSKALLVLSKKVKALPKGEPRMALLQTELGVTAADCFVPVLPPELRDKEPVAPQRPATPALVRAVVQGAKRLVTALSRVDASLSSGDVSEKDLALLEETANLLSGEVSSALSTTRKRVRAMVMPGAGSGSGSGSSIDEEDEGLEDEVDSEVDAEIEALEDSDDLSLDSESEAEAVEDKPPKPSEPQQGARGAPLCSAPPSPSDDADDVDVEEDDESSPSGEAEDDQSSSDEDKNEDADEDADDDDSDDSTAAAATAEPELTERYSAPRPERWRRDEIVVPVFYPNHLDPSVLKLSPINAAAVTFTAAAKICIDSIHAAHKLRGRVYLSEAPQPITPLVAALYHQAYHATIQIADDIGDELEPHLPVCLTHLADRYRALCSKDRRPNEIANFTREYALAMRRYNCARDASLPLPTQKEDPQGWEAAYPLQPPPCWAPEVISRADIIPVDQPVVTYLTTQLEDPLNGEGSDVDKALCRLLGLLKAVCTYGDLLFDQFDQEDLTTMDPALLPQCWSVAREVAVSAYRLLSEMQAECQEGRVTLAEDLAQAEARKQEGDAGVITLGESQRVQQYIKIGTESNGSQIAITAETPQQIVIAGDTGLGKTHATQVMAEALHLHLPGLSTLTTPQSTVRCETAVNQSTTRQQMLSGYYPNGDPAQLADLLRYYGYRARGNEAYTRGKLYVFPWMVAELKITLAKLVERGLEILPAYAGPQDLGMVGYRGLLSNAGCMQGSQKPRYMTDVESLITEAGEDATPDQLIKLVKGAKLRGNIGPGLIRQLEQIRPLIHKGARFNDCLLTPDPVFLLLAATQLAPDVVLPFQAALLNALRRALRNGKNPLRWIFLDEFNKSAQNQVMIEATREHGQERRHHMVTMVYNGQRLSGMDRAFLSQATIFMIFRLNNIPEIHFVQQAFYPFASIPEKVFATLEHGECIIGAAQSTGKHQVYKVKIRPAVTAAGGETLRVA